METLVHRMDIGIPLDLIQSELLENAMQYSHATIRDISLDKIDMIRKSLQAYHYMCDHPEQFDLSNYLFRDGHK